MRKIGAILISTIRENRKVTGLYLFLLVFFILLINIAIAPLQKIHEFEARVNSDSLFLEKYDSIYYHVEMQPLVKEKAYKEALLKLAESDSIQLVVNLRDSLVNLSIKGVVIHQTHIRTCDIGKIFKMLPVSYQTYLFSMPMTVVSEHASIVKEPIVVRHAPKDTLEAAQNAWQPDTLIQKPAFLFLSLDSGINLIFEQDKTIPTFSDNWQKLGFYSRIRIRNSFQALADFACLKKQDYHPLIKIKIPADDLRAIYRALPANTYVVINI